MKTIGERIKTLRKTAKLTQKDVADKLSISTAAVTQWENDVTKPSGENLLGLARILGEYPEKILGLEDAFRVLTDAAAATNSRMKKDKDSTGSNQDFKVSEHAAFYAANVNKALIKLPIISWVSAGQWNDAMDNFEPGDADDWQPTTANVSNKAFALRVEGDSMHNPNGSPSIPEGSIIIVDPEIEATSGRIVVAKLTDSNQVTLKKLIIDGPNTYLKPLNPDHSLIKVNGNCVIVGVVKQVIQDL